MQAGSQETGLGSQHMGSVQDTAPGYIRYLQQPQALQASSWTEILSPPQPQAQGAAQGCQVGGHQPRPTGLSAEGALVWERVQRQPASPWLLLLLVPTLLLLVPEWAQGTVGPSQGGLLSILTSPAGLEASGPWP